MSNRKKVRPMRRKSVGQEIIDALTEIRDALESGESLEERFTVRTVKFDLEPGVYDSRRVRATRDLLQTSQAVFARLLGVSPGLVRAWELGGREPSRLARRMMDEFNRDPRRWIAVLCGHKQSTTLARTRGFEHTRRNRSARRNP